MMETRHKERTLIGLPAVVFFLAVALTLIRPSSGVADRYERAPFQGRVVNHHSSDKVEAYQKEGNGQGGRRSARSHRHRHDGHNSYCQADDDDTYRYDQERVLSYPYAPHVRRYKEVDRKHGRVTYGYEQMPSESGEADSPQKAEEGSRKEEAGGTMGQTHGDSEGKTAQIGGQVEASPGSAPLQGGTDSGAVEGKEVKSPSKGGRGATYKWISVPLRGFPPAMESPAQEAPRPSVTERNSSGPELQGVGVEPYGRIVLDVYPNRTKIYIDGRYMGEAEKLNEKRILVKPGEHAFLFKDGENSVSFDQRVDVDTESVLSRNLESPAHEVSE